MKKYTITKEIITKSVSYKMPYTKEDLEKDYEARTIYYPEEVKTFDSIDEAKEEYDKIVPDAWYEGGRIGSLLKYEVYELRKTDDDICYEDVIDRKVCELGVQGNAVNEIEVKSYPNTLEITLMYDGRYMGTYTEDKETWAQIIDDIIDDEWEVSDYYDDLLTNIEEECKVVFVDDVEDDICREVERDFIAELDAAKENRKMMKEEN